MGESFGPYRLERLLGRGGMGEVYRAYDTVRVRTVAVKRLHPYLRDPAFERRFRLEAEATAQLSSPHVVPIHDYGEIDGRLFIDMRLIDGADLHTVLARSGPLAPARAVEVVRQLADALDSAHSVGLVHRDVKPSNAVLAGASGRDFVYLVDFGIVRAAGATASSPSLAAPLTGTGMVIGTLAYMAPELFTGSNATPASDVYALACLLFEALTARAPFVGEGAALMHQHLAGPPPHPHHVLPEVPESLGDVVVAGLAKDPAARPPSAGEFAAAAVAALQGLPSGGKAGGRGVRQSAIPTALGAVPASSGIPAVWAHTGDHARGPTPTAQGRLSEMARPLSRFAEPEPSDGIFQGPRFRVVTLVVSLVAFALGTAYAMVPFSRCLESPEYLCGPRPMTLTWCGLGVITAAVVLALTGHVRGPRSKHRNTWSGIAIVLMPLSLLLITLAYIDPY
ncbi:serine/threonine-protein kinase [Actinomycetospora flava]|uniref:non-specific serine/threonine protein kinase n=1 Tax=Actinomycetospora flava TaxID=3129232 RepID=A0ABU8MDE6_9PSEU